MKRKIGLLFTVAGPLFFVAGCWSSHKVDINTTHKVEPIEININVNVRIQDDLSEKFKKQDEVEKKISNSEAEEALKKYLESEE